MSYYCFVPIWDLPLRRKHVYSLHGFPFIKVSIYVAYMPPSCVQLSIRSDRKKEKHKKTSNHSNKNFICPLLSTVMGTNTLTAAVNESQSVLKALIALWTISQHNEVILHLWDRVRPNIREMTTLMCLSGSQPEPHSLPCSAFYLLYICTEGYCAQKQINTRLWGGGSSDPWRLTLKSQATSRESEKESAWRRRALKKMSIKTVAVRAVWDLDQQ